MINNLITVVIKTIGRPTLLNSINSANIEFGNVIVISDNIELDVANLPTNINYYKLGRKFDRFGTAGNNLAALVCKTPYICLLDDDDEFVSGAGEYMLDCVTKSPNIDIWIPGLIYNDGNTACIDPNIGVTLGNVAVPTYKTELLFFEPYNPKLIPVGGNEHWIDYYHIQKLYELGFTIRWYEKILYRVRPTLSGKHGTFNPDIKL